VLLQNNDFHFRFVISYDHNGRTAAQLIKRAAGTETTLATRPVTGPYFYFQVEAHGQAYSFYIATQPQAWQPLAQNVDGRILSTTVAGGFVGTYLGMYASSNGRDSDNIADFDWFEYLPLTP
jgi:alpha-N-arabinofuranosidase